MYAIILGCGTTGIKVAEWLMASGAEVTLIEEIGEKQRLADNLLGSVVVTVTVKLYKETMQKLLMTGI